MYFSSCFQSPCRGGSRGLERVTYRPPFWAITEKYRKQVSSSHILLIRQWIVTPPPPLYKNHPLLWKILDPPLPCRLDCWMSLMVVTVQRTLKDLNFRPRINRCVLLLKANIGRLLLKEIFLAALASKLNIGFDQQRLISFISCRCVLDRCIKL